MEDRGQDLGQRPQAGPPAEAQLSHSAVPVTPAGPWQGQSDTEPPATTAPGTAQQQHCHKAETEAKHPGQKPTIYVKKATATQSILRAEGNGEGGPPSPPSPTSPHHRSVREHGAPWQEGAVGVLPAVCPWSQGHAGTPAGSAVAPGPSDPWARSSAIPVSGWCWLLVSQAVCWAGAHGSLESSELGLFLLGQTLSCVS